MKSKMGKIPHFGGITFAAGITCGTVGYYVEGPAVFLAVFFLSALFAVLAAAGIDE